VASLLICDAPAVTAEGYVTCSSWQTVDYESLVSESEFEDWEQLLGFDSEVFGIVLVGLLLAFVSGHVVGLVVRGMNRT